MSLSDLLIQTARRRPFSQLSRMMPATWRPLPAPVPSPSIQPRRKRTAFSASLRRRRDDIPGLVDGPRSGEVGEMRLAGIDHALELRIRQQAVEDDTGRQMRPIAGFRRRHGSHCRRLDEPGRMRLRARNADRLQYVWFVERVADAGALARHPINGLICDLDLSAGTRATQLAEAPRMFGLSGPRRAGRASGNGMPVSRLADRSCRNEMRDPVEQDAGISRRSG